MTAILSLPLFAEAVDDTTESVSFTPATSTTTASDIASIPLYPATSTTTPSSVSGFVRVLLGSPTALIVPALTSTTTASDVAVEYSAPRFSTTVIEMLAGRLVRAAYLIELEFTTETMCLWLGYWPIEANGRTWTGVGKIGSVSGLDLSPGMAQQPVTLTLSGIDTTIAARAKAHETEVRGRRARIWLQYFDASWQPLDQAWGLFAGKMDKMTIELGATLGTVSLTVEHILVAKHRPPYGYYSHADQIARFPGDLGLERMALNQNRKVAFP